MIIEDHVSYEIALLLKEKGFNEECYQKYDNEGYLSFNHIGYINSEKCCDDFCALAPTLQMVLKWLREKYEVFISIGCCTYPKLKKVTYIPEITTFDSVFGDISIEYDSYEEACETAIKYCLENLI